MKPLGSRIPDNSDDQSGFVWEKSGLYQGDIMRYPSTRNVATDKNLRWENSTIPFYIEESHFDDEEIETILSGIQEFHKKSCLRFKPYRQSDPHWVLVTGNESGCWSAVGMQGDGGQQLNLNSPKCVEKGVVIHEFLHAAGFHHQQCASNRDEFVRIRWENIISGKEHNFEKYNESMVTDFGVAYDYGSVMHYSRTSFSKNGKDTIEPTKSVAVLGQRIGFSKSDLIKLKKMYEPTCHQPEEPNSEDAFDSIVEWFRSLFV